MESASLEPKPIRRGKLKKQLPSVLFLTPFTVFFLMFTIVPILAAIVLSFTYFNMVSAPTFVGFDNYIRLFFNDDVFLIALKNTAIFAMITGPISYVLSFFVAWLCIEFVYCSYNSLCIYLKLPIYIQKLFINVINYCFFWL